MICEKCGEPLESVQCRYCGEPVLKLGDFCYRCGRPLQQEAAAEEEGDDDFSDRILCSDGNCIGIINEAGVCKVCGKPYVPESS